MGFVVIEGLDGSGKSTQLKMLSEYLDRRNVPFKYLHFPRLEEGIYGKLIARFLRGEMGANEQVDPYMVALIFAGDRTDASLLIREWMGEGYLVIVDRYVYSNIAFQCAKLTSSEERDRLRDWILEFEFAYNKLPKPDVNLYLNVPFEFTREQLKNTRDGDDRAYLKGERDIHEENIDFQEQVQQVYLSLTDHVEDLKIIQCMDQEGLMLAPGAISDLIVKHIDLKE
ncbi:MAG: dTMP kinase [Bacteroidia bacterium]|nr:MAG: dTMP kinase [Bacteroidia bacterium]